MNPFEHYKNLHRQRAITPWHYGGLVELKGGEYGEESSDV
jgi:hypothetical protein